jgi:hypothetical protein
MTVIWLGQCDGFVRCDDGEFIGRDVNGVVVIDERTTY